MQAKSALALTRIIARRNLCMVPSTNAMRRGRSPGRSPWAVPAVWPVGGERPAVLDQLALDGVRRVVRRQEAGPVGGVEGLDADGAGSVCRVQWGSASASGAMLCPRSRRLRAYDDAVTDHDTAKLTRGAALCRAGRRNAAAGGQAHAAPDAEPVRQGL